jgi:hypothetical protein
VLSTLPNLSFLDVFGIFQILGEIWSTFRAHFYILKRFHLVSGFLHFGEVLANPKDVVCS